MCTFLEEWWKTKEGVKVCIRINTFKSLSGCEKNFFFSPWADFWQMENITNEDFRWFEEGSMQTITKESAESKQKIAKHTYNNFI